MVRVDENYLYFDTKYTIYTKKKITGHTFVTLAGYDSFNKRGDAVLQLLKLYKSQVDPKYLHRGDYAEMLVRAYLSKVKNRKFIFYDEQSKNINNYDFFPNFKQCGGIPDIEFTDFNELGEVKSKSMDMYDEIAVNENIPQQELYQALFYSYLRQNDKTTMFYVFFDKESEELLFENKKPLTNKNIKLFFKTYNFKDYNEELQQSIKKALNFYNRCVKAHKIPLIDISPKVLEEVLKQNNG